MPALLHRAVAHLSSSERRTLFGSAPVTWTSLKSRLHPVYDESLPSLVARLKRTVKNVQSVEQKKKDARLSERPLRSIQDVRIQWKGNVEIIYHTVNSPMHTPISLDKWNRQPFTQIKRESSSPTRTGVSGWPRGSKCTRRNCFTLYDTFLLRAALKPNTLCLFHGTIGRFRANLLQGLRWTEGVGALGPGFYMTHNPNVAKSYACRAANIHGLRSDEGLMVLEILVTDAHLIQRVYFDSVHFLKPDTRRATFVVNEETGYDGQVAVRGAALSRHCHVRAVHHFASDPKLMVTGTKDSKREPCLG